VTRGAALAALLAAATARAAPPPEAALTLERAVELALARNEAALQADERVRAAEARVAQARSLFLPDLTLQGTYSRSTREVARGAEGLGGAFGATTGTASASLPLFDARSFPLYRQARLERAGARAEADDARQVLAFQVATSFVAALSADQVVAAAERRLQLARATHQDARERAEAGLVGSNDVTRAELELWSAERDLARARSAAEGARIGLAYLLDAEAPRALAAPAALLDAAAGARGEEDALAAEAARRRGDLRALGLRTRSLEAFAEEPRMRLVPSLALTAGLRAVGDDRFAGFEDEAFAGATLTWALWDGGQRAAERRERLALARIASLEARAATRATGRDVRAALATLRGDQDAAGHAQAAAAAARRNAEESAILYRQGLAPALAVADANLRLFQAEVDLAQARFAVARSFLDLRRAVGVDPLGRELP
jgi:outer membrane protein TolC